MTDWNKLVAPISAFVVIFGMGVGYAEIDGRLTNIETRLGSRADLCGTIVTNWSGAIQKGDDKATNNFSVLSGQFGCNQLAAFQAQATLETAMQPASEVTTEDVFAAETMINNTDEMRNFLRDYELRKK